MRRLARLFRPRPPAAPPRLRFVATRDDGLCMRLITILDAALLAHALDGDYAFLWDEADTPAIDQQTTSSASAVFDPAFLARHRIAENAIATAPVLDSHAASAQHLRAQIDAARPGGTLRIERPLGLESSTRALSDALGPRAFADLFDALGLSAPVRAAIVAARALPLPDNAVAIHIRGGDVVHGTHSHMATYLHKAPSLPEIAALATRLTTEGRPVWLVGQEPDLQEALAATIPGVRTLGPARFDDVAQVIFDATFMARMSAVWGGNSGVTALSRRIGGIAFTDMARMDPLVSADDIRADPMAAPAYATVSANAKAHASIKPVIACPPADWTATHADLVAMAMRYRPGTRFLPLIDICVSATTATPALAETRARDWLSAPLAPDIDPDLGLAFLQDWPDHFPLAQVAALGQPDPATLPALALVTALAARIGSPGPDTTNALATALAGVDSITRIDPTLRAAIARLILPA
jgi:hypothetical protein